MDFSWYESTTFIIIFHCNLCFQIPRAHFQILLNYCGGIFLYQTTYLYKMPYLTTDEVFANLIPIFLK